MHVLIAGCGDIGSRLAHIAHQSGARVSGLRRHCKTLPDFITPMQADVTSVQTLQHITDQDIDYVLIALTADEFKDEAYQRVYVQGSRNLMQHLPPSVKRVFFISSTSVYHQHNNEQVDENSPTEPTTFSGQRMLQAEAEILHSTLPGTVLRCSGIYGPGRNRLITQVIKGVGNLNDTAFTNRIHADDVAAATWHLIQRHNDGKQVDDTYLLSDSSPARRSEVLQWLASQLSVNKLTSSTISRAGSKRCNNTRLLESGFRFQYPTFKAGYSTLLNTETD